MATKRYYVTTAIPYVNGPPHVGHALEFVQTDALARYHRRTGEDTYFLTGSDDNSLKNVRAAEDEGIPVGDLVSRNTDSFVELDRVLDISYDQFIRTSVDERHRQGAQRLWRAVQESGDLYEQVYAGLYCLSCEQFYEPDELVDGLCPEHFIAPERVEETNYFFRLSRYQDQLEQLISSGQYRIIPDQRRNEVLSFIRSGLRDFSVSRSQERARGWGIPVPGDETQVMYVWFDALSNYITALGYATDGELYRRYWVENDCRVHVIGKGITRFHAVYWPAMLLSAGVPLPHVLFVHGYYTVEGRRIGKSMGNAIDPVALARRYGSEALRYFCLGATPSTGDTDFSMDSFESRYNADLANDLGNLLNRTVSMIGRYRDGVVPEAPHPDRDHAMLVEQARALPELIAGCMEEYDFPAALAQIWRVVGEANRYVERQAPWRLARPAVGTDEIDTAAKLDSVLNTLTQVLRLVALELEPFLPRTSAAILAQLGCDSDSSDNVAGLRVSTPQPLFPRLEVGVAEQ